MAARPHYATMLAKFSSIGLCLVTLGAGAAGPKLSPAEQFRNYALSACVADGYEAEEVKKDAAAAARGYLELGGLPLEAHTEATRLGRAFLNRQYPSSSGQPLILMKCLDFYHSRELQTLIQKYARKRS